MTNASIATLVSIVHAICTHSRNLSLRPFGAVQIGDWNATFKVDLYSHGHALAVALYHHVNDDGAAWLEPLCQLSVNIVGRDRLPGTLWMKTYGENTSMRHPLLASGWFDDTGVREPIGMTVAEVWRPSQKFVDAFVAEHQVEIEFLKEHELI